MSKDLTIPRPAARITCMVHRMLEQPLMERLRLLGITTALVENGRGVRERIRTYGWGIPWQSTEIDESPMEIFRITVPSEAAHRVSDELVNAGDLRAPGHGMLYVQEITEYSRAAPLELDAGPTGLPSGMLSDMALITVILSNSGSGNPFARIALSLGAGVPVISRGVGTGIRDRLGLLRIAIPPEKEIIRLMVPALDAESIRCLLIEEGRLNRPGGGFMYQTWIREGLVDSLLRIGRQKHAASIEQMIAALDDLKRGTAWRKRFVGIDERPENVAGKSRAGYREIVFSCPEGQADKWVQAAMESGASGATTAQVRCIGFDTAGSAGAARETGVLCVPGASSALVLDSLIAMAGNDGDEGTFIQTLEATAVFSHQ